MSKAYEPNKGKNEQNNGNKTAIFNNHRQNIISYGNKYRQENININSGYFQIVRLQTNSSLYFTKLKI